MQITVSIANLEKKAKKCFLLCLPADKDMGYEMEYEKASKTQNYPLHKNLLWRFLSKMIIRFKKSSSTLFSNDLNFRLPSIFRNFSQWSNDAQLIQHESCPQELHKVYIKLKFTHLLVSPHWYQFSLASGTKQNNPCATCQPIKYLKYLTIY